MASARLNVGVQILVELLPGGGLLLLDPALSVPCRARGGTTSWTAASAIRVSGRFADSATTEKI
jgi:hypothetical protein